MGLERESDLKKSLIESGVILVESHERSLERSRHGGNSEDPILGG